MKQPRNRRTSWLFTFALLGVSTGAATLPSDWQHEQQFSVPAPGLVKLSLPVETLAAARPALEDVRLYDDTGNEVPYVVEHPAAAGRRVQSPKSFQVSLSPSATVIAIETGLTQPLEGVTLESPANNFIKSVQIEGSTDGGRWQTIAQEKPIFRQPNGASQLYLPLPLASTGWRSLRLTVDDRRSQPIPFTDARLHIVAGESTPSEPMPVTITERNEDPGESRLTLNLGAANIYVTTIRMETSEQLFTRQITLAVPQVSEGSIREQTLAQGVIYRVAIEGQPVSAGLSVPLENQVRSRELLLIIRNNDSPPLPITAIHAERRPVYLVFLARQAGAFHLLTGNGHCVAPRYDLAALNTSLKSTAVSPIKLSPPVDNPNYRAPEVLPGIEENGTALDVSAWKFRKPVRLIHAGAQQLELDVDVLSHSQPDFRDLRLSQDERQVPYILEHTSINRALMPAVTVTNIPKDLKLSQWIIKLPRAGLPLTRLACAARTPLFQREMTLYEEVTDERGEKYRNTLGQASWIQTPDRPNKEFALTLANPPQSNTLFLETQNGDNPPIELEKFQVFHPATRLLFKTKPADDPFLYYGNPRADSPRYDLSLVAGQLLAADKAVASLDAEQQLKKTSWRENWTPGNGGVIFWGMLASVVVVLLIIISRLLPKPTPPSA